MTVNKHLHVYITEPFKDETFTKCWFKVRYQDRLNVCLMLGLRRTLVIAVKYYHILTSQVKSSLLHNNIHSLYGKHI